MLCGDFFFKFCVNIFLANNKHYVYVYGKVFKVYTVLQYIQISYSKHLNPSSRNSKFDYHTSDNSAPVAAATKSVQLLVLTVPVVIFF